MNPNEPNDIPPEAQEAYSPFQRVVLGILQWAAWTAAFVAMLYAMRD